MLLRIVAENVKLIKCGHCTPERLMRHACAVSAHPPKL